MGGQLTFINSNYSSREKISLSSAVSHVLHRYTHAHTVAYIHICQDVTPIAYLYLFSPKKSEIPILPGCQSTEEPNIARGGSKVLFVHRKPSEQTACWNNGACWATTNHRGWVLCFRESAENTKLVKRCARRSNTDDTGLSIENAAQPCTVNQQAAIGLAILLLES